MQVHVNIAESHHRVIDLVLRGHCQNLLDDPPKHNFGIPQGRVV